MFITIFEILLKFSHIYVFRKNFEWSIWFAQKFSLKETNRGKIEKYSKIRFDKISRYPKITKIMQNNSIIFKVICELVII